MTDSYFNIKLFLTAALIILGCNSPRTPDFSHTENESQIPEGQRTSDSNRYDGRVTDTVSNDNKRTGNSAGKVEETTVNNSGSSQKANDSTSGSRITSDGNDLRNTPTPDSRS